jgi:hypothetical protein
MFKKHEWQDFYRDARDAIPIDMPKPRGNPMLTLCFVDASHGSNRATRRSQTGILIFCNKAPIIWHSKRKNTVEASSFGREFQAMKMPLNCRKLSDINYGCLVSQSKGQLTFFATTRQSSGTLRCQSPH